MSMWAGGCAAVVLVLAGCRPALELPDVGQASARPLAHAGVGATYVIGETITLDGSGSFDPDGEIVRYRWRVATRPSGSVAEPADAAAVVTSFAPDALGAYTLRLSVEDDSGGTDESELSLATVSRLLGVSAGADVVVPWYGTAKLSGSATAIAGVTPTYDWTITVKPSGSNADLVGATTATPSLNTDVAGGYVVTLTVHAGAESKSDDVLVTSGGPVTAVFAPDPTFAYSRSLDRLVLVNREAATDQLLVVDPVTGSATPVAIPHDYADGTVVDPSGQQLAYVDSDGITAQIVVMSLTTLQIVNTYPMPNASRGLVFGSGGRLHSIPADGAVEPIQTIDLATGATAPSPAPGQYLAWAAAQDGTVAYLADDTAHNIYRVLLTTAPLASDRQTFIVTTIGPKVVAEDHRFVLTFAGVLMSGDLAAVVGNLQMQVDGAAHSAAAHELAVFNGATNAVYVFDDTSFVRKATLIVPASWSSSPYGFLAYNTAGDRLTLVVYAGFREDVYRIRRP